MSDAELEIRAVALKLGERDHEIGFLSGAASLGDHRLKTLNRLEFGVDSSLVHGVSLQLAINRVRGIRCRDERQEECKVERKSGSLHLSSTTIRRKSLKPALVAEVRTVFRSE